MNEWVWLVDISLSTKGLFELPSWLRPARGHKERMMQITKMIRSKKTSTKTQRISHHSRLTWPLLKTRVCPEDKGEDASPSCSCLQANSGNPPDKPKGCLAYIYPSLVLCKQLWSHQGAFLLSAPRNPTLKCTAQCTDGPTAPEWPTGRRFPPGTQAYQNH